MSFTSTTITIVLFITGKAIRITAITPLPRYHYTYAPPHTPPLPLNHDFEITAVCVITNTVAAVTHVFKSWTEIESLRENKVNRVGVGTEVEFKHFISLKMV